MLADGGGLDQGQAFQMNFDKVNKYARRVLQRRICRVLVAGCRSELVECARLDTRTNSNSQLPNLYVSWWLASSKGQRIDLYAEMRAGHFSDTAFAMFGLTAGREWGL